MHPDMVAAKVGEAHSDLVQHVLAVDKANGSSRELKALINGEGGPGVQEVITARAIAELARQVADLTEKVRALEPTKDTKKSA